MITQLTGKLAGADIAEVVVDVNGVGYAVTVPLSTHDRLPRPGADVTLYTHLNVREDALQLYGFATVEERRLFRLLLTVSGIGPRLALNVLSCLPVSGFCAAVAAEDTKALARISGIGKRLAERLVVELRDRVEEIEPAAAIPGAVATEPVISREAQDAVAALETLGFKSDAARKVVRQLCSQLPAAQQTAENLIRRALGSLNA